MTLAHLDSTHETIAWLMIALIASLWLPARRIGDAGMRQSAANEFNGLRSMFTAIYDKEHPEAKKQKTKKKTKEKRKIDVDTSETRG